MEELAKLKVGGPSPPSTQPHLGSPRSLNPASPSMPNLHRPARSARAFRAGHHALRLLVPPHAAAAVALAPSTMHLASQLQKRPYAAQARPEGQAVPSACPATARPTTADGRAPLLHLTARSPPPALLWHTARAAPCTSESTAAAVRLTRRPCTDRQSQPSRERQAGGACADCMCQPQRAWPIRLFSTPPVYHPSALSSVASPLHAPPPPTHPPTHPPSHPPVAVVEQGGEEEGGGGVGGKHPGVRLAVVIHGIQRQLQQAAGAGAAGGIV